MQQPLGHDVALQTQAPEPLHVCPLAHREHAAPLTPQVPLLEVWHFPVLSQQPEQDVESQTQRPPVLQCCPTRHAEHAAPPVPQLPACSLAYTTQLAPLQQPLAQEPAVHVHAPALHVCPDAQTAHAAPPVPQVALPEVWHWPLESQHPDGHDLASHTHLP